MPDIFISYSRTDSAQAEQLAELLTSAGLSCWIDRQGIDLATSWSREIVQAINECKAFIVLLSPASIVSNNVVKEISLASEKRKKILPLDLEPVALTEDFEYQLAGLQRSPMTNIDAIIRALGKLGLEATQAPILKLVKETDTRKSLMILPFEDLSPTADNAWFADGLATELIGALSLLKALRVADQQATKDYKRYQGSLPNYAKEMAIRFFVQGSVRKFDDQIKISVSLLDIETGDHLWQDSMKGTMQDIFDIQETVAKKVLAGLDVILTKKEEDALTKKPTENVEAYELFLKAQQYFFRQTKSDWDRALGLWEESARLDPKFATVFAEIANTCQAMYRQYDRRVEWLDRAKAAADRVRELEGETARYAWVMSKIALRTGDTELALSLAQQAVERDPGYALGYDALGLAYQALGRPEEWARAYEEFVRLLENNANAHFSLLIALSEIGNKPEHLERLQAAAERAIPVFERHLRLNPDDNNSLALFACVLWMAGRDADSAVAAEKMSQIQTLDGRALYTLACLYLKLRMPEQGMETLQRAVASGSRNLDDFRRDPDLDVLRGTPEFEYLLKSLEAQPNA
jgi:adenylate cyclase